MTTQPQPLDIQAELVGTAYQHLRALAVGGMGEVHVVRHAALKEERVLKVVRNLGGEQTADHLAKRMMTEGRLLRALRHPNIVELLDLGVTSTGKPYLVTELLNGGTLKDEVGVRGPLYAGEVFEILDQILAAINVAHGSGIVHRDLKPLNVFYEGAIGERAGRNVKVLDFGIAKVLSQQAKDRAGSAFVATQLGYAVGSPSFMPPEQVIGGTIDHRADLYAIGCVGYYLLTGRPPFGGKSADEVMANQLTGKPPSAHEMVSSVPRGISDVLEQALAKSPDMRFESAEVMRKALAGVRSEAAAPRDLAIVKKPVEAPSPAIVARPGASAQGKGFTVRLSSGHEADAEAVARTPSGADADTIFQRVQSADGAANDPTTDDTQPLPPDEDPNRTPTPVSRIRGAISAPKSPNYGLMLPDEPETSQETQRAHDQEHSARAKRRLVIACIALVALIAALVAVLMDLRGPQ